MNTISINPFLKKNLHRQKKGRKRNSDTMCSAITSLGSTRDANVLGSASATFLENVRDDRKKKKRHRSISAVLSPLPCDGHFLRRRDEQDFMQIGYGAVKRLARTIPRTCRVARVLRRFFTSSLATLPSYLLSHVLFDSTRYSGFTLSRHT